MNKIYLLLVIAKLLRENAESWVLNQDIGVHTISGFKLTEEKATRWAKERCEHGEELPNEPVSEEIEPFEHYIYIDHQCVFVEPPNCWEKRVKFKGFRRKGLELPIYGYIELRERPESYWSRNTKGK